MTKGTPTSTTHTQNHPVPHTRPRPKGSLQPPPLKRKKPLRPSMHTATAEGTYAWQTDQPKGRGGREHENAVQAEGERLLMNKTKTVRRTEERAGSGNCSQPCPAPTGSLQQRVCVVTRRTCWRAPARRRSERQRPRHRDPTNTVMSNLVWILTNRSRLWAIKATIKGALGSRGYMGGHRT